MRSANEEGPHKGDTLQQNYILQTPTISPISLTISKVSTNLPHLLSPQTQAKTSKNKDFPH